MKRFNCIGCGYCCSFFSDSDKDSFLPLYDFETRDFLRFAENINRKPIIRPVIVFLDGYSGNYFSILYGAFNSPCVFYDEKIKRCLDYLNRPFVCRTYPLFWAPKYVPNRKFGISCFGVCKSYEHKEFLERLSIKDLNEKETDKIFFEVYGSSYNSCLNSNKVNLCISKMMEQFEKEGRIKISKTYDFDEKRVMGFFDFLVKNKLISDFEKNQIISDFNKLKYSV